MFVRITVCYPALGHYFTNSNGKSPMCRGSMDRVSMDRGSMGKGMGEWGPG